MNFKTIDQTSSYLCDNDACNTSPSSSPRKFGITKSSTPTSTYKPRVNFHSIESLATSFTPISSPSISYEINDDTGYSSFNSSTFENHPPSKQKPRRKLSDWQIWHLREVYSRNRYPTPHEQEHIGSHLLLPTSSVRIWFQNSRARCGKK